MPTPAELGGRRNPSGFYGPPLFGGTHSVTGFKMPPDLHVIYEYNEAAYDEITIRIATSTRGLSSSELVRQMATGTLPGEIVVSASMECGGDVGDVEDKVPNMHLDLITTSLVYFHGSEKDAQARQALRQLYRALVTRHASAV